MKNKRPALTARQQEILEFLKEYQDEWGCSATLPDIVEQFSFTIGGAQYHVEVLKRKKYISNQPGKHRSIVIIDT